MSADDDIDVTVIECLVLTVYRFVIGIITIKTSNPCLREKAGQLFGDTFRPDAFVDDASCVALWARGWNSFFVIAEMTA